MNNLNIKDQNGVIPGDVFKKGEIQNMQYVAVIKDCRQYSEDAWEPVTRVRKITKDTTLEDLLNWQKKIFPNNNNLVPMQIVEFDVE